MSSSFKPSSGGGGAGRVIHQDFIARIRHSNALPPPAIPTKLLDVPNTGLASGQYTTPGFASRLAREQPLNIEADAELGMPLDLVGMPGIFDGDESSIQAPSDPPALHPDDKLLLRPLAALARAKAGDEPVSFLRRTEYISSSSAVRRPATNALARPADANQPKKRSAPDADDSPAAIRRRIMRSFELGKKNLDNLPKVTNPFKKRTLKVVDGFKFAPDLDAFPDAGAYVEVKFGHNPVQNRGKYDDRMLNGALKPCEKTPEEEAAYAQAVEMWERDPMNHPKPPPFMNYDFYLHRTGDTPRFRAKFDVDNPENEEDGLYTAEGESGPCFEFTRLRGYETTKEVEMDHKTKYDTQLFVGFAEEDDIEAEKAAWYYPVMQKSVIRPQRQRAIDLTRGVGVEDQTVVEQLDVTVEDPTDELREHVLKFRENPRGWDEEEEQQEQEQEEEQEEEGAGWEETEGQGSSQRRRTPLEEDAEGDEE